MFSIRRSSISLIRCLAPNSKSSNLYSSSHFQMPLSFFTSKVELPSPETSFIVKYLIDSVGLSSEKAIKASKFIAHIKSPSQPDSVLHFFKQNGFTDADIKRIDELGIPRGSWMFFQALRSLCSNTSEQIDAKIKLMSGLGFSEAEVSSAIRKQPYILSLSEKNLRETVTFLVKEAGCDHSYLSSHPNIFTFSLSRRLVPRNLVLKLLKAKGMLKKDPGFYNVSSISEMQFVEKFIFRYKEKMPELHDVYLSASSGEVPS